MFNRQMQYGGSSKNPQSSKNEANLMPVPSPQQIQYLNPLDGQELTIQKQPNTMPHHVLSERFKKSNFFEKEASGSNAKIDKNEVVNEGAFQCSICYATFEETNSLKLHFYEVHQRIMGENANEVSYLCFNIW